MSDRLRIRCSDLPRLAICAGGFQWPGVVNDPYSAPAELGTAVHRGIEHMVTSGGQYPDVADLCEVYRVEDEDELRALLWYGKRAWDDFRQALVNPHAEGETERAMLFEDGRVLQVTGHPDIIDHQPDGDALVIIDWKSGRVQYDASAQIRAYGWTYLERLPHVQKVVGIVVWLRDRSYQSWEWSRDALEAWAAETFRPIVDWDGVYHSNALCGWCPRCLDCPAQTALIKSAVGSLVHSGGVHDTVNALAPSELGALFEKIKQVERLCSDARDAIKYRVQAHGPLQVDEQRELAVVESEREAVEIGPAWDFLHQRFSERQLAGCLRVSKTALMNAAKENVPRGGKGAACDALMDELRQRHATVKKTVESLVLRAKGD